MPCFWYRAVAVQRKAFASVRIQQDGKGNNTPGRTSRGCGDVNSSSSSFSIIHYTPATADVLPYSLLPPPTAAVEKKATAVDLRRRQGSGLEQAAAARKVCLLGVGYATCFHERW